MNLNRAQDLALDLMYQHGITQQGWRFKFDRAVRRIGACHHRTKRISLSQYATSVNDEVAVRNTILHEIAHAICGFSEGHGPVWKAKCLEIGGDGNRLGSIAVRAPHKWQIKCSDCGYIWKRYRRPHIGFCHIHKCQKLLQRIGYVPTQPWRPVESNLRVEALA